MAAAGTSVAAREVGTGARGRGASVAATLGCRNGGNVAATLGASTVRLEATASRAAMTALAPTGIAGRLVAGEGGGASAGPETALSGVAEA